MAMTRIQKAWLTFLATRLGGLAIDILVLAVAYCGAFALRYDFHTPRVGWYSVALSFVIVLLVHIAALLALGCYRLTWRRTSRYDITRYVASTFLSCVVLTLLRFFTPLDDFMHVRPPYSVTVLTFILSSVGIAGWRFIWTCYARKLVSTSELLERNVREMSTASAARFLGGRVVMVTGAGGTIGSEIAFQVASAGPKLILLVERGENALYNINRKLSANAHFASIIKPLLVDINDVERMDEIFSEFHPEVVLHAAAYKHLPMVEMNPREGEKNNSEATRRLAEMSKRHGVDRFVLISTDKAVNPISVMGRTKREAEKAVLALNDEKSDTSFCAVRFGNVLGSSGSVVPLFKEQIANGGPLTVTHPDMMRYFMTVEEAVGLVIQAASRSEKAIYTLDMGKPVLILDLAEQMIRQSGYRPYVDIGIVFTGVRPGEKISEELDISEESAFKTDMAKIYITRDKS